MHHLKLINLGAKISETLRNTALPAAPFPTLPSNSSTIQQPEHGIESNPECNPDRNRCSASLVDHPPPTGTMRDIAELPHDLFLVVISYLSPRTCVLCRRVSRQWHAAFTSEVASLLLLRWNFPRCREFRLAAAAAAAQDPVPGGLSNNQRAELVDFAAHDRAWSDTLAHVARRYYHLSRGRPYAVEKLEMAVSSREDGSLFSFWEVAPWNRFLRLHEKTANFHHPDPVWWYSQEDGVLVYPAATRGHPGTPPNPPNQCDGYIYHIYDLSTGQRVPVPFDIRAKHIRRVRLAHGVLIIEWAEALPYHQLNDLEVVHRHFVTAFDVIRRPSACPGGTSIPDVVANGPPRWTWHVEFRSEWKLHFLGLPLNRSDRFFSAHTASHYAVYFWQPNRSLYQDDPIEQLAVWDISSPSPYRPSEDPRGDKRPTVTRTPSLPAGLWHGKGSMATGKIYGLAASTAHLEQPRRASLADATAGPRVVRRMAWRELDFYGLRQRATPQLRSLALDGQNLYVVEEEHRWADGQHSSLNPPRVHLVRSTGIPIVPAPVSPPPRTSYPAAARSTSNLSTGTGGLVDPRPVPISTIIDGPVNGPIWVDACGADGDVNMNFCRRVASANGTAGAGPVVDVWPPLLELASQDYRLARPSATATGWPWVFGKNKSPNPVAAAASARWPGWAPCWRHEDFPYLTVTEMVDFAAGVRVTARHCFMLESLSVHVRPAVSVKGAPPADRADDGVTSSKADSKRRDSNGKAGSGRYAEAQFPDKMWSELVARGHIAGDERWIVGEDERERITIVRF